MNKSINYFIIAIFIIGVLSSSVLAEAILVDHTKVPLFNQIPESVINQVKNDINIFYGHTSHGGQIITGMWMLKTENILYNYNSGEGTLTLLESAADLGTGDGTPPLWYTITVNHLNSPYNETNTVVWSWCGGVSYTTEANISNYLYYMTQLELAYPAVKFIYMTGHLDGTGPTGVLYINNNQIRDYCALNEKILYDFADIESYDPYGNYYPDESDACAWCVDWCAMHTCDMCPASCAHSHCFNCYQKGKAFWWLLATLTGWQVEVGGCGDVNSDGSVDILDVVYIINYKYKSGPPPAVLSEADVDGSGDINILDVVYIINYKYKSGPVLNCPEE